MTQNQHQNSNNFTSAITTDRRDPDGSISELSYAIERPTHTVKFHGGHREDVMVLIDNTHTKYGFLYGAMLIHSTECDSQGNYRRWIQFGLYNATSITPLVEKLTDGEMQQMERLLAQLRRGLMTPFEYGEQVCIVLASGGHCD